jgi:membrane-bound ClpP family serine protease
VRAHGEIWTATAHEPIHAGDPIQVVAVTGLLLTVAPLGAPDARSQSLDPRAQSL